MGVISELFALLVSSISRSKIKDLTCSLTAIMRNFRTRSSMLVSSKSLAIKFALSIVVMIQMCLLRKAKVNNSKQGINDLFSTSLLIISWGSTHGQIGIYDFCGRKISLSSNHNNRIFREFITLFSTNIFLSLIKANSNWLLKIDRTFTLNSSKILLIL